MSVKPVSPVSPAIRPLPPAVAPADASTDASADEPLAAPTRLVDCLAPAKLNLFLHIVGRRADGYHLLQTVFQLLDWGDRLDFERRDDGQVVRESEIDGVPADDDLTVRAARLLQAETGTPFGVSIAVRKVLPMGAGLGGGSSDAATTLLALNRLWDLGLTRARLKELALRLGADVPFFVHGENAFAEGVGEALQTVPLPTRYFLVVTPPVHVATAKIFTAKDLTRDSAPVRITDFLGAHSCDGFGRNDMQPVVIREYAEVAQVLDELNRHASARMTGSGASVFCAFASRQAALDVAACLPADWRAVVAKSLDTHPLHAMAS
ncbi:4-(cytidine 5'-diphospho)-2-C-methyl-D-erythritol kinase [Chitinasiproducens palmae]|uniref:4-diphosphocytidyl-2-C-methyl-D-erythritol kinase n=1 Tax=Chitinasiproducens palmae TaxID=1770053 RepID=A0A1H2PNH0_9BURK|nr:4-(cytidine 5'-diphospho)-2-C-methyl-D-erythritol kinase [Chitinasiproducens palmae]SDV48215.1 4-diphosphocytidyl-2-C-methyl-D-erythritol kinase [Chitinasiproducens palmae]